MFYQSFTFRLIIRLLIINLLAVFLYLPDPKYTFMVYHQWCCDTLADRRYILALLLHQRDENGYSTVYSRREDPGQYHEFQQQSQKRELS